MSQRYIGLMSGTSLDGIDAAIVDLNSPAPQLEHALYLPMPNTLRSALLDACNSPTIEYRKFAHIDVEVARLSAKAVNQLLSETGTDKQQIVAIGSHGQTIYHQPDGDTPTTIQVGDPNLIAELTGITTVADFRRRDVAARGQGAPLVPAFHQAVFSSTQEHRVILNIGGIANITVLPKTGATAITGFDTGPGNVLMDYWYNQHLTDRYDNEGAWSASGSVHPALLQQMLRDAFFSLPPPKSTGREKFNGNWLYSQLKLTQNEDLNPADVQATLCELTARSIARAINQWAPETEKTIVCGGGVHNLTLMERLKSNLAIQVESSTTYCMAPDWVEAMAFAWLAKQTLDGQSGNLPTATGASHPVILGGIYQR